MPKKQPQVTRVDFDTPTSGGRAGHVRMDINGVWYVTKQFVELPTANKVRKLIRYKKPGWQGRVVNALKQYTLVRDTGRGSKGRDKDIQDLLTRLKTRVKESILQVYESGPPRGKRFDPLARGFMGYMKRKGKWIPVFRYDTREGRRAVAKSVAHIKRSGDRGKKGQMFLIVRDGRLQKAYYRQGRVGTEGKSIDFFKVVRYLDMKLPEPGWYFREKGTSSGGDYKRTFYGPFRDKLIAKYMGALHRGRFTAQGVGLRLFDQDELVKALAVRGEQLEFKKPSRAEYQNFHSGQRSKAGAKRGRFKKVGGDLTYREARNLAKVYTRGDVSAMGKYAYERNSDGQET